MVRNAPIWRSWNRGVLIHNFLQSILSWAVWPFPKIKELQSFNAVDFTILRFENFLHAFADSGIKPQAVKIWISELLNLFGQLPFSIEAQFFLKIKYSTRWLYSPKTLLQTRKEDFIWPHALNLLKRGFCEYFLLIQHQLKISYLSPVFMTTIIIHVKIASKMTN